MSNQDEIGTQMLRIAFYNQESEVRGRWSWVRGQNRGHKLIKPRKKAKTKKISIFDPCFDP